MGPRFISKIKKRSNRYRRLFLSLILCFFCVSNGYALDTERNRMSLRGLDRVGVIVEPLPPEIEAEGLGAQSMQRLVESKLKAAGIIVLSGDDFLVAPGRPAVYINARIAKLATEQGVSWGYMGSIDISLTQNVYLVRSPDKEIPAATWNTGIIGIFPDVDTMRRKIEEAMVSFISAYQAANEPEPIKK
jgi:hypothetical protein